MKKIQETIESPPIEVSEQRERKRSRTPQPIEEPITVQVAKPVEVAPVTVVKAPEPVESAPIPVVSAPAPVVSAPAPVVSAPAPVVKAPAPVEKAAETSVVQEKPSPVVAPKADSPAPAKKKEGK